MPSPSAGLSNTAIAGPIRLQDWPEIKRLDSNTRLARPISLIEERPRAGTQARMIAAAPAPAIVARLNCLSRSHTAIVFAKGIKQRSERP